MKGCFKKFISALKDKVFFFKKLLINPNNKTVGSLAKCVETEILADFMLKQEQVKKERALKEKQEKLISTTQKAMQDTAKELGISVEELFARLKT